MAVIGLFFALALSLFVLVLKASTQSHFEDLSTRDQMSFLLAPTLRSMLPSDKRGAKTTPIDESLWNDPAGTIITNPEIWETHAILHRLRRLHLAIGMTVIAMSAALWADNPPFVLVAIGLFSILVVLTFATTFSPKNWLVLWVSAVSPILSLILVTLSVVMIYPSQIEQWRVDDLHTLTFGMAVVLGTFAMLSIFGGGLLTVGSLVIATQLGAVLGIAVGLITESVLGLKPVLIPHGAGWVAVAMLFLLGILAIVALILTAIPNPRSSDKQGFGLLRKIVLRGHWLFYAAGAFGITAGVVALWESVAASVRRAQAAGLSDFMSLEFGKQLFAGFTPDALGQPRAKGLVEMAAVTVGIVVVLLAWWRICAAFGLWWGLVVPGAAIVIVIASAKGFLEFSFLKLHFELKRNLVEIAAVITVLVPGVFMLKSIVSGVREGEERRRQVGILWDLGSFWPRWFHPLSPPAYGPVAVSALVKELSAHPRDVVAAHSQGSLIAAVAVARMDRGKLPRGFLTYGSQLGVLYPKMFPAARLDLLVEEVQSRFPYKWINLWRDDDPIGGHFVESLGSANWQVCTGNGHSGHEVTAEYQMARSQVLAGTTTWPPGQDRPDCWDR